MSASSNSWQVISKSQDSPPLESAPVSEVMAGSFCREKQIANILEVKSDESDYLLRFKDGSEEWVGSEELDETTKQFFKLSEPVKRALSFSAREQIKIENLDMNTIYKISTSGINFVCQLKQRYTDNAGCATAIDLYRKDKETGELVLLSPEMPLPILASKVFAKSSSSLKAVDTISSLKSIQNGQLVPSASAVGSIVFSSDMPAMENDEEEKKSVLSIKSSVVLENKELSTAEATSEVNGAVGGSGGNGLLPDGRGSSIEPKFKMTESICAKMSEAQRMKLAMKMSDGTLTCQDLQDALRESDDSSLVQGPVFLKNMFSSIMGLFGGNAEEGKVHALEESNAALVQEPAPPNYEAALNMATSELINPSLVQSVGSSSQVPDSAVKSPDQEQKPVEDPSEVVYDIVIEAKQDENERKIMNEEPRPIIHSQPVFDNSRECMNEWLQSLTKIGNKDALIGEVDAKINEIETAHAIKLSEIENRHKVLVNSLRDIIRRQSSEKSEISQIMKQNKMAILTAIEAELTKANNKFEQGYESYLQTRNTLLEDINRKLDRAPVEQPRKVFDEKRDEPSVAVENNGKSPVCSKKAPTVYNCPGGHGLKKKACTANIICDICEMRFPRKTEIHSCRPCDFDICGPCFRSMGARKSESVVKTGVLERGVSVDLDRGFDIDVAVDESVDVEKNEDEVKEDIVDDEKKAPQEYHLEMANVSMSKGGLISEPMEVTIEMKNTGEHAIECLVSLTSKGDSSSLTFTGFKNSAEPDRMVLQISIAPGDSLNAVMEFNVPHFLVEKKYDFDWQLTDFENGVDVGPLVSLRDIPLYKPLEDAVKEDKVRKFCSLGCAGRDVVITVLEANGWNLNEAVNAFMLQ